MDFQEWIRDEFWSAPFSGFDAIMGFYVTVYYGIFGVRIRALFRKNIPTLFHIPSRMRNPISCQSAKLLADAFPAKTFC